VVGQIPAHHNGRPIRSDSEACQCFVQVCALGHVSKSVWQFSQQIADIYSAGRPSILAIHFRTKITWKVEPPAVFQQLLLGFSASDSRWLVRLAGFSKWSLS